MVKTLVRTGFTAEEGMSGLGIRWHTGSVANQRLAIKGFHECSLDCREGGRNGEW